MNKVSSEKLLLVGKVIKPHGIKGLLKVWSYARTAESFQHSGAVFIKQGNQDPIEYKVLDVKPQKNIFLMRVKGVDTFEEADNLRGADILVDKDDLVRTGDDEYYWFELIDLRVYLDTGKYLGNIKEIIPTGSNDVYVVKQNESEFLIPAISEVVKKIDLDKGEMIISAMDGLLDLNEV